MTPFPGKLPTMRDVAVRAGVSRQTVSLVLRGDPGPSTASRALVLTAADELGYQPNLAARLLRQPQTRLIGFMFDARNPFEARIAERLLERAPDIEYGVVLAPTSTRRSTDDAIGELIEHRIEALACFNPDPASRQLERAITQMPVIWMGEKARDGRVDVVRSDQDTGLRLLVNHLRDLGHTRISYAGGLGGTVGADRAEAYRQAMRHAGQEGYIDEIVVSFSEEDGAEAARRILARRHQPTAVIGCSDQVAEGMLAVFTQAGVKIPDDISITGYDDSDVAALSYNGLTCIRQDVDLTVDAVLAAVERRGADPQQPPRDAATTATLVIRSSTAAPPDQT